MKIKDGDILLLYNGNLVKILEVKSMEWNEMSNTQFMDKDEYSFSDIEDLHIHRNLGQSPEVYATFAAARSIHLRLNALNKV